MSGAEIATAYVRLRPVSDSFRAEAQSQIRSSMQQLNRTATADSSQAIRSQVDLAKKSNAELMTLAREQARVNIKSGSEQIRELHAVGAAYASLARDATLSGEEQRAAARLAAETNAKAMTSLGHESDKAKEHMAGLRDSVKELAATFGTTIGIIAGLNFAKQIINSAAEGQKAAEAITSQFGKAGAAVKAFAEGTAADMGVSAALAETTAAKFGIAYQQIGVGQDLAAQMTIGFEKLAASIATIRGIKPDEAFAALSQAATGSTRSLRMLGISIDQQQIKWAALKLGIISSIKDALTPAQKAEAVYALATARLGIYQKEAAQHAGDLANVQGTLSARWKNAKEILGEALLPALTRVAKRLSEYLGHAQKTGELQRTVNRVLRDFHQAVQDATAVITPLVKGFQVLATIAGGTHKAIEAIVTALLAMKARKFLVEFGLIDGGLTTMGNEAGTAAGKVALLKKGLLGLAGKAFVVTLLLDEVPRSKKGQAGLDKKGLGFLGHLPVVGGLATQYEAHNPFGNVNGNPTTRQPGPGSHPFPQGTALDDFYQAAAHGRKPPYPLPAHGAEVAAWILGQAVYVRTLARRTAASGPGLFSGIFKQVGAAGRALTAGVTGAAAAASIQAEANAKVLALNKKYNVGQAAADRIFNASVKSSITGAQQRLAAAIRAGRSIIGSALSSLQNYIRSGTLSLEAGLRSDHERLTAVGKQAIKNLTTLGAALTTDLNKFQAVLASKVKKPGTPGGQGPFGPANAQLLKLISGGQPSAALQQQILAVQSQLEGKVPKVKGAQTAAQKLAEAKRLVQEHIALLVEQAQKGQITIKQLGDRLGNYMHKQGFVYTKLAHTIGKAGADKIRADVDNLTAQLRQIGALPAGLRKKLLSASHDGLASPVVNIVTFMARQAAADKARQDKYNVGLRNELAKLHRAQVHAGELVKSAQKHLADVNAHEQLRTQQHTLAQAKVHTALLKKIHTTLLASKNAQKALAAVQVNNGFATSLQKANGATSTTARTAAAAGITGGQ